MRAKISISNLADERPRIEKEVSAAVTALTDLDLDALRLRRKKMTRKEAPPHLPRWLLLRMLAYRLQAETFGDLDRATVKLLDQIADAREARRAAGEKLGKKPPVISPVPPRPVGPGTVLLREHDRVMHRVVVTVDGYSWNGKAYRSLSEVAFAITGTRWNGPRFFGLREKRNPAEKAS